MTAAEGTAEGAAPAARAAEELPVFPNWHVWLPCMVILMSCKDEDGWGTETMAMAGAGIVFTYVFSVFELGRIFLISNVLIF